MTRDRRLAVTARAPGLGLTVDYTSTVVEPARTSTLPTPVTPVTRVTPPASLPKQDWITRGTREGLWATFWQMLGLTTFGVFFLILALQGAGPIAWGFAILLLSPLAVGLVFVPILLIGAHHRRTT